MLWSCEFVVYDVSASSSLKACLHLRVSFYSILSVYLVNILLHGDCAEVHSSVCLSLAYSSVPFSYLSRWEAKILFSFMGFLKNIWKIQKTNNFRIYLACFQTILMRHVLLHIPGMLIKALSSGSVCHCHPLRERVPASRCVNTVHGCFHRIFWWAAVMCSIWCVVQYISSAFSLSFLP